MTSFLAEKDQYTCFESGVLISRLRTLTRDQHNLLERSYISSKLLSKNITVNEYFSILCVWREIWCRLESFAIKRAPRNIGKKHFPPIRADILTRDICSIRTSASANTPTFLDVLEDVERKTADFVSSKELFSRSLKSASSWYAVSYLLYGSLLGSRIVYSNLRDVFQGELNSGFEFFKFDTYPRVLLYKQWNTWLSWMEQQLIRGSLELHTINTINEVYQDMILLFNEKDLV